MPPRVLFVDAQALLAKPTGKKARVALARLLQYVAIFRTSFPWWQSKQDAALESVLRRAAGVTSDQAASAEAVTAAQSLIRSSEVVALVLDGDRVVAGCTTRHRAPGARKEPQEIDNVCVSPDSRRRGLCKLLIVSVARHYSDLGDPVGIVCETDNPAACACYASVFSRSRLDPRPDKFTGKRIRRFSAIRKDVAA